MTSFLVVLRERREGPARVGVTVTRKIGNAVRRNRIRRVVREVFRRNAALFPPAHDLVFVARPVAVTLTYAGLLDEIRRALRPVRPAA